MISTGFKKYQKVFIVIDDMLKMITDLHQLDALYSHHVLLGLDLIMTKYY